MNLEQENNLQQPFKKPFKKSFEREFPNDIMTLIFKFIAGVPLSHTYSQKWIDKFCTFNQPHGIVIYKDQVTHYKNGQKHGSFEVRSTTHMLKIRYNYFKDLRDGLYESWYLCGQPYERYTFSKGLRDGLYERWNRKGLIQEKCNYSKGSIDGLCEQWYSNGQRQERYTYVNDKKNGLFEGWYIDGRLATRRNYIDDILSVASN